MATIQGAQCLKISAAGGHQVTPASNRAKLVGLQVIGGTSVNAIAYDGTDSNGRHLGEMKQATLVPVWFGPGQEPVCRDGLHVIVAGTAPEVLVWYIE